MKRAKAKHNILVVDDELQVRRVICKFLHRKGFSTICARHGKDAIEKLKKKPALIILDVIMPVMDGFAFLQSLRGNSKYSRIPVIMLTVKSSRHDVARGLSMEADFYLPKPFKLDNLLSFINLIVE